MKNSKGFTLIELMISLVVGLLVLLGAIEFYMNIFTANTDSVRLQRFEQIGSVLLSNMTSEIRRAGYDNPTVAGAVSSPGFDSANGSSNCLRFSSEDAVMDGTGQRRFYGYQLLGGVFYYYSSAAPVACGVSVGWTSVTENMEVLFSSPAGGSVFTASNDGRLVNIQWVATSSVLKLPDANPVTRKVNASIHVRNAVPEKIYCPDIPLGEECKK